MVNEEKVEKRLKSFPKILLISFVFIIFGSVMSWGITGGDLDDLCNVNDKILFKNSTLDGNWSCATLPDVMDSAYIRVGCNVTQKVMVSGEWQNVTFTKKAAGLKKGFTHDHTSSTTNTTITVVKGGIYHIDFFTSLEDPSPTPSSHIGVQMAYVNGSKVLGSYAEDDPSRANTAVWITKGFITELSDGDAFTLQFTSDDTDVSLLTHATFESGASNAQLNLIRMD